MDCLLGLEIAVKTPPKIIGTCKDDSWQGGMPKTSLHSSFHPSLLLPKIRVCGKVFSIALWTAETTPSKHGSNTVLVAGLRSGGRASFSASVYTSPSSLF